MLEYLEKAKNAPLTRLSACAERRRRISMRSGSLKCSRSGVYVGVVVVEEVGGWEGQSWVAGGKD